MTCHVLLILTEGAGCKDSDVIWGLLKLSDQAKPSTGQHSTIYMLFLFQSFILKKNPKSTYIRCLFQSFG